MCFFWSAKWSGSPCKDLTYAMGPFLKHSGNPFGTVMTCWERFILIHLFPMDSRKCFSARTDGLFRSLIVSAVWLVFRDQIYRNASSFCHNFKHNTILMQWKMAVAFFQGLRKLTDTSWERQHHFQIDSFIVSEESFPTPQGQAGCPWSAPPPAGRREDRELPLLYF